MILALGMSFEATGKLWAVEENPEMKAIGEHTSKALNSNIEFVPAIEEIKNSSSGK